MGTHRRSVRRGFRVAILLAILSAGVAARSLAADDDAGAKLFRETNGAVVALENIEGSGSGFIIDRSGLILTNAHVIASPFPFKCTIDVTRGSKTETVVFQKVKIIGVHPEKDLALVKIDPKEHNVTLQVAHLTKTRPEPGQQIFAIGNPGGGGMVLNKTITSGMLSGVNRVIDKVTYYQVSAAINPGNSGGPLFNSKGEVIGIVTLKFTDVENTGFAIPLYDLDTSKFVKLKERRADPQRAKDLLAEADKFFLTAKELEHRHHNSSEAKAFFYMAAQAYHEALSVDPTNDSTYYNIGMLLRTLGHTDLAEAYLMQSIQMNPWQKRNNQPGTGLAYFELGLSLYKEGKKNEARIAWEEGLSKFPTKAGNIWENLAVLEAESSHQYYAAYDAQVSLTIQGPNTRPDNMKTLVADMRKSLKPDRRRQLDKEVARIPVELKRRQVKADKQFQSKKDFLTPAFADYMKREGKVDSSNEPTPKVVASDDSAPDDKSTKTTDSDDAKDKTAASTEPAESSPPVKKVALPPGTVDLLSQVSVRQDAFKGTWTEGEDGLGSPSLAYARLIVPAKVPDEYDLLIIAERQSNKGEFVVGFPRGGHQSLLYLDALHGTVSGLDPDSRDAYQGAVLTSGKPIKIVMKVRREGLLVTADGKQIVYDRTNDPFPAVPSEWNVGDESHLFIGTNTSRFRIYQMALRPYERP